LDPIKKGYNVDPIPGPRCYENFQNTQYGDENFNISENHIINVSKLPRY
jgi:hypothetical protein